MLKLVRLVAPEDQRQHRHPRKLSAQIAKLDFAEFLPADHIEAVEQIHAMQIDIPADIVAKEDIERPPAQQRTEDCRPAYWFCDALAPSGMFVPSQRRTEMGRSRTFAKCLRIRAAA